MLDFTKELILHIQGLDVSISNYFIEIDSTQDISIPPDVDIKSICVEEIGGSIPQLVHIIYLNDDYQEQQQAYMCNYLLGNLVCNPIHESSIEHPFSKEYTLSNSPIGITIHIPSKYIKEEGWLSIYQKDIPWITCGYELDKNVSNSSISLLHT